MAICKRCGSQVPVLVPKQGMGVCPKCAEDLDRETEKRENAIIQVLEGNPLITPVEISTLLNAKGVKIASTTLYDTLSRLTNRGRINRSGSQYFVEGSRECPKKE